MLKPLRGSINKQISRYETTAVYTHPDAKVDIILVHGLNGEPQKTWTAKNGVFWPADLLPASLRDARANVLVYGYNADVYSKKHGSNPSDNFIYMHAQTLVTSLTHYRKDELTSSNPIIWVCHSLGGILVKRALLYSNDLRTSQHEDYRSIYVSTYGIVFLGTPHTGSDIATWGAVLQAMSDTVVPRSFFQSESVLLKTLKRDNETLQNINNHFLDVYQRFKILMAHENHKTDLKGTKTLVVDATSAGPQLPGVTYYAIEATHSGMCKFDSKNAPGYRTIATVIREWVFAAPDVILTRWRVEQDDKLARAKHEIEERMKPWIQSQRIQADQATKIPQQNNDTTLLPSQDHSSIQHQSKPLLTGPEPPIISDDEEYFPSQQSRSDDSPVLEPIFVKPSVFRPNAYFVGREKELKQLRSMLTDRKRRSVGTSSVLIQSMPGGGKSHLARQYVFRHRYDYPGGIFWIRAKTVQELEYGYYDIAKVAELSEVVSMGHNQADDTRRVVKAVQAWLSSMDNWLLVLDGIHFDFDGLEHYIPFAKNTSIIYTSTERTTGEEYQFDNPQVMALDPLTKREAQELLFEEMGKKKPYTQDDLQRAEELVQLMDRLPLMIHVAALQLKATREPLAKYLRSYKSRPKVGNLPAYRAVVEQLEYRGAINALNLMSLLAFFGTHIPVEMVALGAKALDKRTQIKSRGPESRRGSLNLTFRILIAFALIERNEFRDLSAASTRSARSVDMAHDNLDILRIHGIVQAFFVDFLNEKHEVDFWLERAVRVFCGFLDTSDRRVENDPQTGIPEDYRRIRIHAKRLLSHFDRFEKRYPGLRTVREELESRVGLIQNRIDQLTKRANEAAGQGSVDIIVSVFERTNSLSESETSPSSRSLYEYSADEGTETVESPSIYPAGRGPWHWHLPLEDQVSKGCEASRTVTPQLTAAEIFESMPMPGDDEIPREAIGPGHRTIKKHAARRYREHAGCWRSSSQLVSDPRISRSRETVRGYINQPSIQQYSKGFSSSDSGPSIQSEAEISLSRINKVLPGELGGSETLIFSDGPPARPRLMAGRPSYANARAERTDDADFPVSPTFSYPQPTSKEVTATILKLKGANRPVSLDGPPPVRLSSLLALATAESTGIRPPLDSSPIVDTPEDGLAASVQTLLLSPEPPSRPASGPSSRPPSAPLPLSARSSPSQRVGPFSPPPPVPIDINTTSSLRSGPSATSHRLSTHSLGDNGGEAISPTISVSSMVPGHNLPYPYTAPVPPDPVGMPEPPAPWVASSVMSNLHPQGYSSQPMSRDTSHQSNSSIGSRRSLPQARDVSPNSFGQGLGSPVSQVMRQPRARRPSVVETEPSPRLNPREFDSVVTSYQLYEDSRDPPPASPRHFFRSRKRRGSSPGPKILERIRSIRTRSESRRRMQDGSASVQVESNTASNADRGGSTFGTSPSPRVISGEEMTRSGSAGIRLDHDTVVEFGSPPSQTAAAIAQVKRKSPRLSGGSPLAGQPYGLPRNKSTSPPSTRGSPPGVGLGIQ
ncbi:putative and NB-ARC domain-containing protein [Rosellinia necatrix]|uniref:Putative and NB-ARC domain-containing protein n=1 Tax=Rosellinia necatrix TaxID=77044 RepID=A0A1S7UNW4_ROSNE|nr:putative and NB-ARC domain-containing protein [Rosellinia necatrix]